MPFDMQQKQRLVAELRQEQQMTHQQIQALELLSVPVLELEGMINAELESNPILDTEGDNEDIPANTDDEEWLELILKLDENRRFLKHQSSYHSSEDDERRRHYLESVTYEPSLHEKLDEQLRFVEADDEVLECCQIVIAGLDDDGYLSSHPADIAMAAGVSLEKVEQAIKIVQNFEPAGVAAHDLQERLLLQLRRQGREDSLAYRAVHDYLDEIAANHLPQVARKLKISLKQFQDVLSEIHSLSPRLQQGEVSPHEYIEEEVTVAEKGDRLEVHMNNGYLPSLHISNQYRKLLQDPSSGKDVREYVKEKIRSGVFLINSIIQRQTTIQKIVTAIVDEQQEFFFLGPNFLKPMTMAQVAEKVSVHETTVSRAVAGKYMRCKHGLIPLRKFFTTGYEDERGNSVSNSVVKTAIKNMIDGEDEHSPLSDSQIARELKKQGLKVARRTVAKYRESMGILPSNLRRKY